MSIRKKKDVGSCMPQYWATNPLTIFKPHGVAAETFFSYIIFNDSPSETYHNLIHFVSYSPAYNNLLLTRSSSSHSPQHLARNQPKNLFITNWLPLHPFPFASFIKLTTISISIHLFTKTMTSSKCHPTPPRHDPALRYHKYEIPSKMLSNGSSKRVHCHLCSERGIDSKEKTDTSMMNTRTRS